MSPNHNFFEKGVRKRVIIPGYFVVSSHPDHESPYKGWTGYAQDTGYAGMPADLQKRDHKYFRVTSNAQCTSIATNLLLHKQMDAEKGHGFAPMNCGQEVFDYVNITDSKVGDTRAGNIGYINRKYLATGKPTDFSMEFRFGSIAPGQYLGTMPPAISGISTAALALGQMSLWDAVNAIFSGDPETGWLGLLTYLPDFDERITEAKDEIVQIEPDAGIPSGGGEGGQTWVTAFDGSTDSPTSIDWGLEADLPFTLTGQPYFSPIIEEVPNIFIVYIIDSGTNFWKYNLTEKEWTKLASPTYSGASAAFRNLSLNPLGTKLACISECTDSQRGGRRIEIYTISSDTWAASGQVPNMDDEVPTSQTTVVQGLVWADANTIWCWASRAIAAYKDYTRCIKYSVSSNTFTIYSALLSGLYYASPVNAAINAAGTIIYGSRIGVSDLSTALRGYCKYTIATDTYDNTGILTSGRNFAGATDRDKLWYVTDATYRQGYIDTADDSENDNQFVTNTDREAGYGGQYGVSDDGTTIVAYARSTAPELDSVIAGGMYLLCTLHTNVFTTVKIEKPNDNYSVLCVNTDGNWVSVSYDHSVLVWLGTGTWNLYYPQTGDYTRIKITYGVD